MFTCFTALRVSENSMGTIFIQYTLKHY